MASGHLELDALNRILQTNIQVLAAQSYPKAIAQLQAQRTQLKQERESLEDLKKKQTATLDSHEKRLGRVSKRLLNENRRVWAIRIWAIKELSTNAVFVAFILLLGLLVGVVGGVNVPNGVVCQKASLCDHFRIRDHKRIY